MNKPLNIYLVTAQLGTYNSDIFKYISLEDSLDILKNEEELGLDTETSGLDPHTKTLLLLQLGNESFQVLFDIASYGGIIPKILKDFLNNHKCLYILQNAKFDLQVLFKQGIILTTVYDTMLAEIIITNGLQYEGRDLASLAFKYCDAYLDKSVRGEIISKGLSDNVLIYGARDIMYLPEIKRKQLIEVKAFNLEKALQLDNTFVVVLAYIEYCGIKLDYAKWKLKVDKNVKKTVELKEKLEKKLWEDKKLEVFSGMIDMWTGKQDCIINWNSPKQVIKLFEDYGINTTQKVKGVEKRSVDFKVLEPQINKFPIIKPYIEYKEAEKEVSTYGYNWKNFINPVTGRIHTSFKQLLNTGRMSSGNKDDNKPNLQNLSADPETRSCFIVEPGNLMCSADYSSQESVVLANFSKEENLLNFYKKGLKDSHSYVAFLMYPELRICNIEDITPDILKDIKANHPHKRQLAKSAAFAIAYGGNGSTISKNCNISKADGEFVYNSYFNAFPGLKDYFNYVFKKALHFKYIEFNNITKRKFFFSPNNDYFKYKDEVEDQYFWINSENPKSILGKYNKAKGDIARLAQNYPVQGSSSDMTKYAAILFFKWVLKNNFFLKVKIVNMVHDEIIIEAPKDIIQECSDVLVECMKTAALPFCPLVPLGAEASIGDHWIH